MDRPERYCAAFPIEGAGGVLRLCRKPATYVENRDEDGSRFVCAEHLDRANQYITIHKFWERVEARRAAELLAQGDDL